MTRRISAVAASRRCALASSRSDSATLRGRSRSDYTTEALEEVRRKFPAPPARDFGTGRAILESAVIHIPDVEIDPEYRNRPLSRAVGMRSGLFVPMLQDGAPLGVIVVARAEPGPFSDNEIELLKTFADQAVIAIENTRLFEEVQARNQDLNALGEVGRAVSSTLDLKVVLRTIVERAVELSGTNRKGFGPR